MKIKRMTAEEFVPLMKKNEPKAFNSPFYAAYDNMSAHEKSGFARRKKFIEERIEIYFGLYNEKNEFVGWSASVQQRPNELFMVNSAVLPKYRKKGWYTKLVLKTIYEAKQLGFQMISSLHTATNNAVIIAKLKQGFTISGFEVLDEVGVLVKMTYFLNPMREEVMRFRTGENFPSAKVKKLLKLT